MVAEKDFKGIVFDIKNIENNILFDCLTCDSFMSGKR